MRNFDTTRHTMSTKFFLVLMTTAYVLFTSHTVAAYPAPPPPPPQPKLTDKKPEISVGLSHSTAPNTAKAPVTKIAVVGGNGKITTNLLLQSNEFPEKVNYYGSTFLGGQEYHENSNLFYTPSHCNDLFHDYLKSLTASPRAMAKVTVPAGQYVETIYEGSDRYHYEKEIPSECSNYILHGKGSKNYVLVNAVSINSSANMANFQPVITSFMNTEYDSVHQKNNVDFKVSGAALLHNQIVVVSYFSKSQPDYEMFKKIFTSAIMKINNTKT